MQTTLLGLAIAFIVALASALIGPHFVDWNQFRPQFELEASRVLGSPVRVTGTLDARLLPTPTLRLTSVEIGNKVGSSKASAEKLDVELALGSLLRGEWRASELSLDGLALDLGLDSNGRVDWPTSTGRADLGSLAIDRLNLSGRVALHDAASGSTLRLDELAFKGDVRALAGTMRGEGKFSVNGFRAPFRVSSGQSPEGKGTRVRLIVDPGDRALSADLDGVLSFDAMAPRYDGSLRLAQSATPDANGISGPYLGFPWRLSSHVKASSSSATLAQSELNIGPDDSAIKFIGDANVSFGPAPLLSASLSARQLDADRVISKDATAVTALDPIRELRNLIAALPVPPMPVQLEINADQIAFRERPVQEFSVKLRGDSGAWTLDQLALLAPGSTRVSLSGSVAPPGASAAFAGPAEIASSDPQVLFDWLGWKSALEPLGARPFQIRGDVSLGPDRIAIGKLNASVGGGIAEGSASYAPDKIELALKADQLDLDNIIGFVRSKSFLSQGEWPQNMQMSLDIARAKLGGSDARSAGLEFSLSPKTIVLNRLSVGEGGSLAMSGKGALDRPSVTGQLVLNASAASLEKLRGLIEPFSPQAAARLNEISGQAGPLRSKLTITSEPSPTNAGRANVRAELEADAQQIKAIATMKASAATDAARAFDFEALRRSNFDLDTRLSAGRGQDLLALLGLDKIVSAGNGPASFRSSMAGIWREPLRGEASLTAPGLAVELKGTGNPWAAEPNAALNLAVDRADVAALFGLKPNGVLGLNINLSSRLALKGDIWAFEGIDSRVGGSRIRGRVVVTPGDQPAIDGEIGIDGIEISPLLGFAIGAAGREITEPLGRGLAQGWRGKVAFQALRAALPGGAEMNPLSGVVQNNGQAFTIDDLKGFIGGGEANGSIDVKSSDAGASITSRLQLSGVDASALKFRNLAMPPSRVSMQAAIATQGRSAAALSGALSGEGVASLENLHITGLEPRVFEIAGRASDTSQVTDDLKLKELVEPFLSSGQLKVASAQIPFFIKDGRLTVSATQLDGVDVRATVSGGYDFGADQFDIRAALSPLHKTARTAPELRIFLNGTPDAFMRSVDVSSLSSWLGARAIDRETRRLNRLEGGPASAALPDADDFLNDNASPQTGVPPNAPSLPAVKDQKRTPRAVAPGAGANVAKPPAPLNANPAASNAQIQPLPPPIEIRPAPGVVRAPKPRPPLQLTPPSSGPSAF